METTNGKDQPTTEKVEQEREQLPDPLAEMTDLVKRTHANFENYRKQSEKRMEELQQMAAKQLIVELLPIIDNFEMALKNTMHRQQEDFIKGIELIYAQLMGVLEQQGVTAMNTERQQFDLYYHEALLKVPSEKPENTILEEFQKGFLLYGQVIRHAKVKVSAGRKTEAEPKENK